MNSADMHAIAQATLFEAITRALPAAQIKAIQVQHIVASEEEMERLARAGTPTEQLAAVCKLLEEQRLQLSELRQNATG